MRNNIKKKNKECRNDFRYNKSNRNILLTGTIDPSVFNNTNVKITNSKERLLQYETAIRRYIQESEFNKIVFVENSGYQFDEEVFKEMAKSYGKKFEFLRVKTDVNKTIELGKSYGEAILIKEGINKSELLKDESIIYKVTGRIFLKNSRQICKSLNKAMNQFIVFNKSKWCNTMFFKVNKDDFNNVLKDAYLYCDEKKGKDIESVYFDLLSNSNIEIKSFNKYPDLTGIVGTTGAKYDRSKIKMLIKNILIKFGFFTLNNRKWGI